MSALILTVPASGTHFLTEFLKQLGLKGSIGGTLVKPILQDDFLHIHPNNYSESFKDFDNVVVTLRHPYKSWLARKFTGDTLQEFTQYWKSLIVCVNKLQPIFFDLDTKDRRGELHKIAKLFNRKPITEYSDEWKPLNESNHNLIITQEEKERLGFATLEYKKWLR